MKKSILLSIFVVLLQTVYSQIDVGVDAVLHPTTNLCSGDSIKVRIKNFGIGSTSNIPIEVKITGMITLTLNKTYVGPLVAGDVDSINVGVVSTAITGFISIKAYTKFASDVVKANDTTKINSNIAPLPNVGAFAVDSICSGIGFALTANGANTYTWSGGSIPTPSNVNPYIHAPAVGTYTYQVIGVNTFGCQAMATKTVKITSLPTITTISDTTCPGDIALISATGGGSYNWGSFGSTAAINVTPILTTVFGVTVTNGSGCTASSSAKVLVRPKPLISVQNDSICINEIAKLIAFGGLAYNWGAFGTADSIKVSPSITTLYPVTVTDNYGCTNSTNATAFVRPNPTIICLVDSLCTGQIAKITASGAYFYNWGTLGTNSYAYVSPSVNTNYSVTGTDIYGCTGVGTASVIIKPGITALAKGDTACMGNNVTAKILNPSPLNSYNWGTIGTGTSVTFKATITNSYRVVATAPNGCTVEATAFILVENKPSLNISINKNLLCLGESPLILGGIPSGGIMSGKGVFNSQMFPDSAGIGTHTIKYIYSTPNAGCTDSFSRTIKVANCSNAITENTGIQKVITFPNPFDNMLQVNIKGLTEGRTTITLLDLSGRIIEKKEMNLNPSADNNLIFDTEHLTSGIYQVRIIKNDDAFVLQVIKQ